MSILVIGSFMMDQVTTTPRVPERGETVIGTKFTVTPGGKGINQAIAAARLGADVIMLGKLGDDANGSVFKKTLEDNRVVHQGVLMDPEHATGVGSIYKELDGSNRIVVVPGANLDYTKDEFDEAFSGLTDVDCAILQLEMDFGMTCAVIAELKSEGIPVILNPAPARELPDELLMGLDYLTPNESELQLLSGQRTDSEEAVDRAAQTLLDKGVKNVIVTIGHKGAYIKNRELSMHVPAVDARAIDTVAAGDSFNGALAVYLSEGHSLVDACAFANKVGAITVTREGAIASLPYRHEIQEEA